MNTVFLSLGGNQGDREEFLCRAMGSIAETVGQIVKRSSVYETAPWGSDSADHFLNMVMKVETGHTALEVLEKIHAIEQAMNRKREAHRNGDRTIDIDILLFNDLLVDSAELQIPHPRMHLRNFVLVPLAEIAGPLVHPLLNRSFSQLVNECQDILEVKVHKETLDC